MRHVSQSSSTTGIIAAGVLYALEHHRGRLSEDNANAKRFAEGIYGIPGIEVDTAKVGTNIVSIRMTAMPVTDIVLTMKDRERDRPRLRCRPYPGGDTPRCGKGAGGGDGSNY